VKLLLNQAEALEEFTPKPFLRLEAGQRLYVAWRFINEVPIERAEALATKVAARLGGMSLGHLLPLPGIVNEGTKVELIHLIKDRLNVLTDFADPTPPASEATSPLNIFTAANTITAEPEHWLWPGVVPSGALTLISGQPKAGKTQITLDIAARVSAGLDWPNNKESTCDAQAATAARALARPRGGHEQSECAVSASSFPNPSGFVSPTGRRAEARPRGGHEQSECAVSAIKRAAVFELEDKAASSIVPRLLAAGADLANIMVRDGKDGPINLAEDMGKVAAAIEQLGGVRLLTLSPLLSFFGQAATDDTEVRRRLAPLLTWAAETGTAIIGVLHPPKRPGQSLEAQFAGADTYRRAARAAWVVAPDATDKEPDAKRKRRALMCAGINGASDDLRLFFRIKGATVDGIETSRIDWQSIDDPSEPPDNVTPIPAVDDWLRQALCRNPRNAAELKAEARAAGIPERTLYRAVKRIGVEITGGGFGQPRVWRL
jgi:hypothetical protein